MKERQLTEQEFESILLYLFVALSMAIRGFVILTTSDFSIGNSGFYSTLNSIVPFKFWGVAFLIGGLVITLSLISQSVRRYYILIVGSLIGAIVGVLMGGIGFSESHQTFTPIQILSIAFFNIILVIHGGYCIWREKKRIHMLRKSP